MRERIEGMAALRRGLVQVTEQGADVTRREVMRSTLAIQGAAKRRAPVDTGRLRNSIAFELEDGGMTGVVGTNVDYAPYVEFGTSRQSAQPFLFPSFEEEWPRFIERLRAQLGRGFLRADRG